MSGQSNLFEEHQTSSSPSKVKLAFDSKAVRATQEAFKITYLKMGSFAVVAALLLVVIVYYCFVASPRYISQAQFIVKQAGSTELSFVGLAGLGSTSPSMRDALVLKAFIESRDMAIQLNQKLSLQAHYEDNNWDWFSRLSVNSSVEDYVKFYQSHIRVFHDELSDVLSIEVQAFNPDFALLLNNTILELSEDFINQLGDQLIQTQLKYAEQEVSSSHEEFKNHQKQLIEFQNSFELFNPETQGGALVSVINQLEGNIVTLEAELKSLQSYLQSDASEVITKKHKLAALEDQLAEEKQRLTSQKSSSLNQVNAQYQELKLNAELVSALYKASLASLEQLRDEAYQNLKHLLIIEHPGLAQEQSYPRKLYSIVTWFVVIILIYLVTRLIVAIIKEHKE